MSGYGLETSVMGIVGDDSYGGVCVDESDGDVANNACCNATKAEAELIALRSFRRIPLLNLLPLSIDLC